MLARNGETKVITTSQSIRLAIENGFNVVDLQELPIRTQWRESTRIERAGITVLTTSLRSPLAHLKARGLFNCLLLVIFLMIGCTSTGNDSHPVKFIGWHQLALGHDKYTPQERDESRCRFRNRLPDGSKSGFIKICRNQSADIGIQLGINSAMYETTCVINMCREAIHHWQVTPNGIGYIDLTRVRKDLDH